MLCCFIWTRLENTLALLCPAERPLQSGKFQHHRTGTNIYASNNKNNTKNLPNYTTSPYYTISEHDDNQQYKSQQSPECFRLHSRKSPITETAFIKKLTEWNIFCYLQIFTFKSLISIQKPNYIVSRTDEKKTN